MTDVRDTEELEILKWQLRSLVTDTEKNKVLNSIPDPDLRGQVELPLLTAIGISKSKEESQFSQFKSLCNLNVSCWETLLS